MRIPHLNSHYVESVWLWQALLQAKKGNFQLWFKPDINLKCFWNRSSLNIAMLEEITARLNKASLSTVDAWTGLCLSITNTAVLLLWCPCLDLWGGGVLFIFSFYFPFSTLSLFLLFPMFEHALPKNANNAHNHKRRAMTAEFWKHRSVLKSWAISLTRRWKGMTLRGLLVAMDLSQTYSTRPITLRLLHTTST